MGRFRSQQHFGRIGLWRDPERGVLAGVCAGFAAWVDLPAWLVRIGVGCAALGFFPLVAISYALLAWRLPIRPRSLERDGGRWRHADLAPDDAFALVSERFQGLEGRLRHVESVVVSGDAELKRRFQDLGA